MRSFILAFVVVFGVVEDHVSATIIPGGPFYVSGVGYRYVDVVQTSSGAQIWFRVSANACSPGDRLAITLTRAIQTVNGVRNQVCSWKPFYDIGTTILGCGAAVGTAICAVAAVPSGGTAAAVCGGVVAYGLTSGYKNCLMGLSDAIGQHLVGNGWSQTSAAVAVQTGRYSDAISYAIDIACAN